MARRRTRPLPGGDGLPRRDGSAVLWDSSAILTLLEADDADHARAAAVARRIASDRRPSFITHYVEADDHFRQYGRIQVLGLE